MNDTANLSTCATFLLGERAERARANGQNPLARFDRNDGTDPLRNVPIQAASCSQRVFCQAAGIGGGLGRGRSGGVG